MSYAFEPAVKSSIGERLRRGPAIVLVGIAALGILSDRAWPLPIDKWLLIAATTSIAWFVVAVWFEFHFDQAHFPVEATDEESLKPFAIRWQWVSAGLLLAGWFSLAGAWHHWRWSCRSADDIANSAADDPQIVRLLGKIIQTPWIVRQPEGARASWQSPERTIFLLKCRSLVTDVEVPMTVSGIGRVTIDGDASNLALGDLVEITGELVLPSEPANPGDFDQRAYLRSQGIFSLIRSNNVECVRVLGRDRSLWDWLAVIRGAIRRRAEELIASRLGPDTAPVAQAMLLGSRVQIDDETRRAFRESGMLHILAISGMNVGLLWSWLWSVSRWMGQSSRTSIWIVLVALPIYALVTDANPPIVRATVVAVIVAFGQMIGRSGSVGNALALAGLVVLAGNPSDLFSTGAQLSFLAVFAILHAMNWLKLLREQTVATTLTPETRLDARLDDSFLRRTARRVAHAILEANVVGAAVWILTSPLVASEFHLVSPIGSLLTVLLTVPVTIMFWIGYSFLLLGFVWSSAFGWLGSLFDVWLRAFLWTVQSSANLELGHVYVPAPPAWWTIGFYGLTLVPILVARPKGMGSAISVRAGLAWMVLGLTWGYHRPPHPGVTCTFISVGHGLSVMIECPNGRTMLYDAGGMVGGGPIARSISQSLWVTGRSRLDAIVISHADGDHCNALPELSQIVSPGGLLVHSSFLDWKQPAVAAAIENTAGAGASIRLISEGQSLIIDPEVSVRVLHPPHDFRSTHDNPNSIVICLEYAGRTIVLTGDLELEGLERLLKTPPIDTDVLLSPHHGSLKANPSDLARWATPEYVIVSTPEPMTSERLASRFGPETQILTTATFGAIRCHISPEGELQVTPFKKGRGG